MDIIKPDDLYHSPEPSMTYQLRHNEWIRAKFSISGWIGKSLGALREALQTTQCDHNISVIRVKATEEKLASINIFIYHPSAGMRLVMKETYGVQGRASDYPRDFKLSFGKYRGEKISEIYEHRREYLQWLYDEANNLTDGQRNILADWLVRPE